MIVQHRLQSSEFVVAVLRSVVVKCCCEVLLRSVVAMAASPDTKMKVVMLGKEATGKTSLVERFLSGRFQGEGQVKSTIAGAYGGRYLLLASVSEQ